MRRAGVVIDLAAVLVFVGIGRSVHSDGLSIAGLASTAWPFVTGLAAGSLSVAGLRVPVSSVLGGLVAVVSTVTIGMVLRVVSGQGTAFAFVLVALGFLGAAMLGWRALLGLFERRRSPSRVS